MSETTQQTRKKAQFNEAAAAKMPTLICTGYVAKVHEGKESESGSYNVVRVDINGLGASKNTTLFVLTRPEWFALNDEGQPAFKADSLNDMEGGKGILFVYRKNMRGRGTIGNLEGLCGNKARFEDLQDIILRTEGIVDGTDTEEAYTVLSAAMNEFLVPKEGESPTEIGYVLRQQKTKTDETDENGKNIYVLENRYEVSQWFEPTEDAKKKYRKSAEKAAKKAAQTGTPVALKVCFDEGTPF